MIKNWLEDHLQFDIEVGHNWFLLFDIFSWGLGCYHGKSSFEVVFGPFSITKQYDH